MGKRSSSFTHRAFFLLLPPLGTMFGFLSQNTHLMLGFLSLNTHLLHSEPPVALLVFLPLFWACSAHDCGRIRISYPFAVDYRIPEFCTYSGFNLTCINNTPFLNLNNQLYQVRDIDCQTRTISVVA
ncbi:hypothetical protein AMTRI_Chr13g85190 [Amborella trichopoda]